MINAVQKTWKKMTDQARTEALKLSYSQKDKKLIENAGNVKVEYLEIAEADTLEPVQNWTDEPLRAFAAAYAGDVRLIDNVPL